MPRPWMLRGPLGAGALMLAAALCTPAAAAAPTGLWLTQDGGGVIAVEPCGTGLCAHIAGVVLDHPADPMPLDKAGASQCHLELIDDARQIRPGMWRGRILDPRNGRHFDVEIWQPTPDKLALRGYFGIALFGRTETWTRFAGAVPDDCRLSPAAVRRSSGPTGGRS